MTTRSERVCQTHGFVVFRKGHENWSFHALLMDDAAEETLHAFEEPIMGKRGLEKNHALNPLCFGPIFDQFTLRSL